MTLIGCATSGTTRLPLPEVPADLNSCFDHIVPAPKRGKMTKKQILKLIEELKLSEFDKTACGKRLLQFYHNLQKGPKGLY